MICCDFISSQARLFSLSIHLMLCTNLAVSLLASCVSVLHYNHKVVQERWHVDKVMSLQVYQAIFAESVQKVFIRVKVHLAVNKHITSTLYFKQSLSNVTGHFSPHVYNFDH